MKHTVVALAVLVSTLASPTLADDAPAEVAAQVMLFGVFHFKDPGQDAVKVETLDITTPESQHYLEALSERIARSFRPTRVLLEYDEASGSIVNGRYAQYRDGNFELPVNEIYQLGFRIARHSGLTSVESFDHREIPWAAEAMLDYAEKNDPQALRAFEERIAELTARGQQEHATLSLKGMLQRQNDPAGFAENKALYVATNAIGARDGYAGADASASWWHRNFRMYANIQKSAQPGERVLVIGGSGHIAIIADLLALDAERQAVDVRPLL